MKQNTARANFLELFFDHEHGKTLDEYKAEHVSKTGKQQFQKLHDLGLTISLKFA